MLTERKIQASKNNPEIFARGETDYAVRSRECLSFTAYRVGGEWEEPTGKRGARKEREYVRKGYACVYVASVHTNAVTVAYDEHGKRQRVTLVEVTVTGEPDAVRDYLDTLVGVSCVRATETGFRWEFML